jgi:beta-xylosidase
MIGVGTLGSSTLVNLNSNSLVLETIKSPSWAKVNSITPSNKYCRNQADYEISFKTFKSIPSVSD